MFNAQRGLKSLHDNSVISRGRVFKRFSIFRWAIPLVFSRKCICQSCWGGLVQKLWLENSRLVEGLRWQVPELVDELKTVYFPADRSPSHEAKRGNAVIFRVSEWIRSTKPTLLVLLESNEGVWQIMQQCWVDDTSSYERFKSDRWGYGRWW